MQMDADREWFRRTDLARRYGVAPITILRWANDPQNDFPEPVKLAPGTTVWPKARIEQFEQRRIGLTD